MWPHIKPPSVIDSENPFSSGHRRISSLRQPETKEPRQPVLFEAVRTKTKLQICCVPSLELTIFAQPPVYLSSPVWGRAEVIFCHQRGSSQWYVPTYEMSTSGAALRCMEQGENK